MSDFEIPTIDTPAAGRALGSPPTEIAPEAGAATDPRGEPAGAPEEADPAAYTWVDYSTSLDGERFTYWATLPVEKLGPMLVAKYGSSRNCFATVQRFLSPRPLGRDANRHGHPHLCPLYFDFDSPGDLSLALEDVRRIVAFFRSLGVAREHVRSFFSGGKGFHVDVDPRALALAPHPELTYRVKYMAQWVCDHLGLQCFDPSVYTLPRQWRLPNTLHTKSGRYCVEIEASELDSIERILAIAAAGPRAPVWEPEDLDGLEPSETAVLWAEARLAEWEEATADRSDATMLDLKREDGARPVCVTDLYENGARVRGTLNKAVMQLAAFAKGSGLAEVDAVEWIDEFAQQQPDDLTTKRRGRERRLNVVSTTRSVYRGSLVTFHCRFIRSIGVGSDRPIACSFPNCSFVEATAQVGAEEAAEHGADGARPAAPLGAVEAHRAREGARAESLPTRPPRSSGMILSGLARLAKVRRFVDAALEAYALVWLVYDNPKTRDGKSATYLRVEAWGDTARLLAGLTPGSRVWLSGSLSPRVIKTRGDVLRTHLCVEAHHAQEADPPHAARESRQA